MKYYYIHNNMVSKGNDLPCGPRIKTLKLFDIFPKYEDGDGPYKSLKELKQNSPIFKKLKRINPVVADKICEKKYIVQIAEMVQILNSTQENLGNAAFEIMDHVTSGKINNNKSFGVHLFNSKFNRIEKITRNKNSHGVWEAKISILDSKSKR